MRLHRCRFAFLKVDGHGCWRAQKALDEAGITYELVAVPVRRSRREEVIEKSGQNRVPVLELDDGTVLVSSPAIVEKIRSGVITPRSEG